MKWSVSAGLGEWIGSGGKVFLLIFCPLDLSIIERRMVKTTIIIVGLSISSCSSISLGFIHFEGKSVIRCMFRIDTVSC